MALLPAVAVIAAIGAGSVGVSIFRAVEAVRRMRSHATTVRPLDQDVDLPGRFPPRWLTVLGDSAAAGHGLSHPEEALARRVGRGLVARDGRATAVRCGATDGAGTADVLAEQVDLARDAEVVILGVGVNDATCHRQTVGGAAEALDALLVAIAERATPGAGVVVLTCPDLSAAPGVPGLLRAVLGLRCRALARAQRRVALAHGAAVVDIDRSVLTAEVFGVDGFHPGDLGHARLATAVLAELTGA